MFSFPAEEPSMAAGAAAVNHRGEVSGASNVEFNNSVRFIARSRSACLEWEHQKLQLDAGKL